jgi:hypothetical protein
MKSELVDAESAAIASEMASRTEAVSAHLTPLFAASVESDAVVQANGITVAGPEIIEHRLRKFVTGPLAADLAVRALEVVPANNQAQRIALGDISAADRVITREFWTGQAGVGPADYTVRMAMDERPAMRASGRGVSLAGLWFGLAASWVVAALLYRQIGARLREVNRIVDAILLGTPGTELQIMTGEDEFAVLGRKFAVAMQIVEDVSTDIPAANEPVQRLHAVNERSRAA